MRKMFILRGAPGSGKSTFIGLNGLDEYTVGFDQARAMLSGLHPTLNGVSRCVGSAVDRDAIAFTELAVRTRARRGETIFVDTTAAGKADIGRWQNIADEYRYELIIVDVQGDLTDEELLERNKNRTAMSQVVPSVITGISGKIRASESAVRDAYRVISPEDVPGEMVSAVEDFTGIDRLIVIGDVQGCATVLNALIDEVAPAENDTVVFVGDLFDRGVENAEVYRSVRRLQDHTTVRFINGNHDDHLYACLTGTADKRYVATRESLSQLTAAGVTGAELLDLCDAMDPVILARFADDAEIWISHGGVVGLEDYRVGPGEGLPFGGYRLGLLPDRLFMYGSSTRGTTYLSVGDYDTDIAAVFADRYAGKGIFAFHGHRGVPAESGGGISFGLESEVEYDGGHLSAAVVSRGSSGTIVTRLSIPNPVTAGPRVDRRESSDTRVRHSRGMDLLAALRASDLVTEKRIDETLSSFNFTRDAFVNQNWNTLTTTARGLFLDTVTGQVAGRGYGKFFNVGERPETALTAVLAQFGDGGTVRVEQKLNGFLGLVFVHDGRLRVFSKSGSSVYADEFSRMLQAHLGERMGEFTEALAASKVTLTFEVLSALDPHIVDDGFGLVLLHAVARTSDRTLLLDDVAGRYAGSFGFRRPEVREVAGSAAVNDAIAAAAAGSGEGVVLRHLPSGAMVKVKSDSYLYWKSLRTTLNRWAADPSLMVVGMRARDPKSQGASAVVEALARAGRTLGDFVVDTVDAGREVDIPRLRRDVG